MSTANRPWTRADLATLKRMAAAGEHRNAIGAALNRSANSVRLQAEKRAISICKRTCGRRRKASPADELEIVAWWKARHAMGTNKQMAAKYGIGQTALVNVLKRHRLTEDMAVRRASREFQEQLAALPY